MPNPPFQRETLLNQFSIGYLEQLAADISDDDLIARPAGAMHTPLWILGHLALVGEMGCRMVGGKLTHREWLGLFAPGTKDEFESAEPFSRDELIQCIKKTYAEFAELAAAAEPDVIDQPHSVDLLRATPLVTVGDVVAHMMTTHFSFHVAQLSMWRQAAGHRYLV